MSAETALRMIAEHSAVLKISKCFGRVLKRLTQVAT